MIEPANFSSSPTQSAASTGGGFAAAFHSRAFRVLWFSEAVSLIGDRILMVALINLVYELSGSAAAVGLLSMIKALPALALAAVAGVFVDRWSRKWIMVISNLILAGLEPGRSIRLSPTRRANGGVYEDDRTVSRKLASTRLPPRLRDRPEPFDIMVGATGIEPVTPTMST